MRDRRRYLHYVLIALSFLGSALLRAAEARIEAFTATARDGTKVTSFVSRPEGRGPFPALVFLHGGLDLYGDDRVREMFSHENFKKFLGEGYVVVCANFRARTRDPLSGDALLDCLAVVGQVQKMPQVDPKSVVVWGASGGGSLALEVGGAMPICAVVAEAPATVLFTGLFNVKNLAGSPPYSPASGKNILQNPKPYFTPELQKFTRDKIAKINCPVLIVHGDRDPLNKFNNDIFIPEWQKAGKKVELLVVPHADHGFSHSGSPPLQQQFFKAADAFFRCYLHTQPQASANTL